MNRLLQIAERESKKIQVKQKQRNSTEKVYVFLDWGRDGETDLRLLTTIKNVPKKIAQQMCSKNIGGLNYEQHLYWKF